MAQNNESTYIRERIHAYSPRQLQDLDRIDRVNAMCKLVALLVTLGVIKREKSYWWVDGDMKFGWHDGR